MELHQMSVQKLTEKLEKAERELAVAVIENADLRERMSSLENLCRARYKDCAAKEAELERVRALPRKWREDGEKEEGQHPCCWAPSKALKELERGMNNAPCILTDSPAEFNDTPLYAHPQPSPDVGALVEALESAKNLIANHSGEVLPDNYAGDQIEQIDAALAAHRKQGGK